MNKILFILLGLCLTSEIFSTQAFIPKVVTGLGSRFDEFFRKRFFRSDERSAKELSVQAIGEDLEITSDNVRVIVPNKMAERLAKSVSLKNAITAEQDENIELHVDGKKLPDEVAKQIKFTPRSYTISEGIYFRLDLPIIDQYILEKLNKAGFYSIYNAPSGNIEIYNGPVLPIKVLDDGQKLEIILENLRVVVKGSLAVRIVEALIAGPGASISPLEGEVECYDIGTENSGRLSNIESKISFTVQKGLISSNYVSLNLPVPTIIMNTKYMNGPYANRGFTSKQFRLTRLGKNEDLIWFLLDVFYEATEESLLRDLGGIRQKFKSTLDLNLTPTLLNQLYDSNPQKNIPIDIAWQTYSGNYKSLQTSFQPIMTRNPNQVCTFYLYAFVTGEERSISEIIFSTDRNLPAEHSEPQTASGLLNRMFDRAHNIFNRGSGLRIIQSGGSTPNQPAAAIQTEYTDLPNYTTDEGAQELATELIKSSKTDGDKSAADRLRAARQNVLRQASQQGKNLPIFFEDLPDAVRVQVTEYIKAQSGIATSFTSPDRPGAADNFSLQTIIRKLNKNPSTSNIAAELKRLIEPTLIALNLASREVIEQIWNNV